MFFVSYGRNKFPKEYKSIDQQYLHCKMTSAYVVNVICNVLQMSHACL